jgi:hypothetical protein
LPDEISALSCMYFLKKKNIEHALLEAMLQAMKGKIDQLEDNFELKAPDLDMLVKQYPAELEELIKIHNNYIEMKERKDQRKR